MTHNLAMPGFARVFHPTDLTDGGEAAFAHGLKIALAARGGYTVVHTTSTAAAGNEWRDFPKVREKLIAWGHLRPGASEDDVKQLGLTVRKADLRIADPGKGISAYAEQQGCDLLVLATHARHGVQRLLGHNVAEPLARAARTPALFVPESSPGFIDTGTGEVRLKNILLPVDLSPDPGRAIDMAVGLAQLLAAKDVVLNLLHVGPQFETPPLRPLEGIGLHWMRRDGPVVDTIVAAAEEVRADLIVMATQGHDGILDLVRGSTTEQVLRRAGRALLAVPE